ncbi:hypothetical protein [sulfur-oxidizing endosymbiont of Gigantopelta aegis]|uniref:IS66 family transposase n=1 Tax=sulfur-oxidizing endosymbiont of Gigantopelta aegis TaxID=2794934 RepID=UPI003CCD80FD
MSSTDKILPEEIPTLKNRVLELQSKVDWYEEQFRLLQHKRFGTSSEKKFTPTSLMRQKRSPKKHRKSVKPLLMSVKARS